MRLIDADKLLTEFKERAEAAEKWQEIAKDEFPTVDKLVKNSINDVLDNPREVSAEEQKCNHLNCPRQFDKVEKDCDINGCPYRTTGITLSALISRQAAIDIFDDYNIAVENRELQTL